jgi:O-acetyl-ADP-ribose deacetylase (regulator of RNase III)
MAEQKGAEYMSFPSISTGVYGYPVEQAADIAISEVVSALQDGKRKLQRVVFVLFDDRTCAAYAEALRRIATEVAR